jgi:hypothetical protein
MSKSRSAQQLEELEQIKLKNCLPGRNDVLVPDLPLKEGLRELFPQPGSFLGEVRY